MGAVQRRERLPVNPRVLRWARNRAGKSLEQAARSAGVTPEVLAAWEQDPAERTPTVRQARMLAESYRCAFLEFFLPAPPEIAEPILIPDFRLYRGGQPPAATRELIDIQAWAEMQRTNALDLLAELAERPPEVPDAIFVTTESDVEAASARARAILTFPLAEQVDLPKQERENLVALLRRRIESLGILTLRRADLHKVRVRGFCLAEFPLPVIVFGSEAPAAQCFTLAHEFAHVLIRQSAISGSIPREGGSPTARQTEEWCNRFAGAFLLPHEAIAQVIPRPKVPANNFSDEILRKLAEHFGVSGHAMLIRLVHLSYVRAEYYWDVKRPEFDAADEEYKRFARSKYYGSRYRAALGDLYTSLVLEAWSAGRITNHHAAEYMGIKNLAHLNAIRDNF